LTGLKWSDIDPEAGTLKVNRSAYNGVVSAPKTSAGRRAIRLSGLAVAALREHRLAAARRRISGWVFCSNAGTPPNAHNLHNRSWKPLLERAGLPRSVRFHDLRHTCATLLLSRGVPVKVVSDMLGHASVIDTPDTYSHVLPDMQHTAARTMEDILRGEPAD
jgi:integrase